MDCVGVGEEGSVKESQVLLGIPKRRSAEGSTHSSQCYHFLIVLNIDGDSRCHGIIIHHHKSISKPKSP